MKTTTEDLLEWNLEKLWNYYNTRELLNRELTKKIKEGIHLKIPLHYILKKYYTEIPESKKVHIHGHGKLNIIEFWDEINNREHELRTTLIQEIENKQITKPRT